MRDGRILFAISAILDAAAQRRQALKQAWRRLWYTNEQRRLQVLAGIRKEKP
jgi:hypothetical protein